MEGERVDSAIAQRRKSYACFICITKKVTGTSTGKVWAVLQSAVVPWGVLALPMLPCYTTGDKKEQFVQIQCLNSGYFC